MDRRALKNFAVYSREKLIADIKKKARLMGIKEKGIAKPLSQSTDYMKVFTCDEERTYRIFGEDIKKYEKLIAELNRRTDQFDYQSAFKTLIEETAYTWFNRIITIRFMEVNNYMPDGMRVLSSGQDGIKEPEFITYYKDTDIGITVEEFKELHQLKLDASIKSMDKLFQFMFVKQCRALNKDLPKLFGKIDDYEELLLNISYNDSKGVIHKLIETIEEEAFNIKEAGQIEIIGWLYQYYNTIPKAEIGTFKNKANGRSSTPRTQIFTPEWIVQYMVENSLGRLWIERRIANGSNKTEEELAKEYGWKYYLPEARQAKEVRVELESVRQDRKKLKIEDIKFMDPSMGSGNILVYAFEMFMGFYLEEGYGEREAAKNIIENNLYGLDIDKKVYQLSCFSLMMKGREYNLEILNKDIENNLYCFIDSKVINKGQIKFFGGNIEDQTIKEVMKNEILEIIGLFENAKELGSIIKIDKEYNYRELIKFTNSIDDKNLSDLELTEVKNVQKTLISIFKLAKLLSSRYEVIVTNPPYLGLRKMSSRMKGYVEYHYPKYKYDLFSIFIKRSFELLSISGLLGFMTADVWQYISSYKDLRENIIDNHGLINFLELEKGSFKDASVDIVSFVIRKGIKYSNSIFINLDKQNGKESKQHKTSKLGSYVIYEKNIEDFKKIPGYNFAYWVGDKTIDNFKEGKRLEEIGLARQGMATTDNSKFLRNWYEVDFNNINLLNMDEYISGYKWYPYNKGGGHRNWYGNNLTVINWDKDGYEVKKLARSKYGSETRTIKNQKFYFKEGITYSFIGITISARKTGKGFLFDVAGSTIFLKDGKNLEYLLALLYSIVSDHYMGLLNPTINIQVGDIKDIPVILNVSHKGEIDTLVTKNIAISKIDWDSFESSWDFKIHPLLDLDKQGQIPATIELAYANWKQYVNNNFAKLKENEERLNQLFIKIYGLEDELTKHVSDKNISIARIFDTKDDIPDEIKGNQHILTKEDVVKSLISYGVGCIFGRYNLDKEGLAYAGGRFVRDEYHRFKPVEDNIALITDQKYFPEDLVDKFIEFIEISFGQAYLRENLEFIAASLKGKGGAKEKIRNYFVNDFYNDHIKDYQKTPIYFLYDSSAGKNRRQGQNAFKALVYIHRYDEDTTEKVQMNYLHKLQRVYENKINFLRKDLSHGKNSKELAGIEKELEKTIRQLEECKDYDEKIGPVALSKIEIDLDDGFRINYDKLQTDSKGGKYKILSDV